MPEFLKTNVDFQKNFIRGAARLVIADLTTAYPVVLNDIIRTAVTAQSEVQTITITGTPAGGTFTLSFKGYTTAPIAYNAAAAAVQTALRALSPIGSAGVTCGGGALPGTAVTVTFGGALAGQNLPMMTANGTGLTGGTTPAVVITETTPGFGQYDAQGAWADLGATKGGITIVRNNAEETFDVDQIQADIMSMPTNWEMNVASSMAQADIDTIQYLWEGGTITVDGTTGERTLPLGTPTFYRQKRLVVLFQRSSTDGGVTAGGIRAYCFRITQRSPQESSIVHNKTGDQANIPFTWRAIADQTVVDPYARFGGIIDQQ
jgi:hypothetical protein